MHHRRCTPAAAFAPWAEVARSVSLPLRLFGVAALTVGLSACPFTETKPTAPPPEPVKVVSHDHASDLMGSYAAYEQGQFDAALGTLDAVLADPQSSASAKRQAYLAKALIRVNGDSKVRDVSAARAALQGAAALDAQAGPDAMASYFAKAVDQVLVAQGRVQQAQAQARQLGRDKANLRAQNKQLSADKATLNAALEKLKKVTLGN